MDSRGKVPTLDSHLTAHLNNLLLPMATLLEEVTTGSPEVPLTPSWDK